MFLIITSSLCAVHRHQAATSPDLEYVWVCVGGREEGGGKSGEGGGEREEGGGKSGEGGGGRKEGRGRRGEGRGGREEGVMEGPVMGGF